MRFRRWLQPGIGVKRWLLLMFAGLLVLALGVAHVLRQISVGLQPGSLAQSLIDLVTLQFLPFALRGAVFGTLGATLLLVGAWRLAQALTEPLRQDEETPISDVIYRSDSSPAARASLPSAAAQVCRTCSEASRSTPATSPRS